MTTSFCTVAQYEARFGEVDDTAILTECLADATAVIAARLDQAGIDYTTPDADYSDRLMRVCRSMANRVMPSPTIPAGVTQATITAGPYSQGYTYATPYGTPRMLPSELALLGLSSSSIGSIPAKISGAYGSNDD